MNKCYNRHMITTKRILTDSRSLQLFMRECESRGFNNNRDLKALKFDWCMETGGMWAATFRNDIMVALSGVHPFKDGYRGLFRGAQTEIRQFKGMNKYQKQNYVHNDHLDLQVQWANRNSPHPVYVTTSPYDDLDRSGRMNRAHRSVDILSKLGVFDYVGEEEVFYVPQAVWRLNIDKYYETRDKDAI